MSRRQLAYRRFLAPLVGAIFLLPAGCVLTTGLGDPQESKVDRAFVGHWMSQDGQQVLSVVPWDDSTCLADWMAFSGTPDNPQPTLRVLNRAWVTTVAGSKYATFQMLVPETDRRQKFLVMQLAVDGDRITARTLNQDHPAFRSASTPAELRRAIEQHHEDDNAFSSETVYRKTTAAATKAIRDAFHSGG